MKAVYSEGKKIDAIKMPEGVREKRAQGVMNHARDKKEGEGVYAACSRCRCRQIGVRQHK